MSETTSQAGLFMPPRVGATRVLLDGLAVPGFDDPCDELARETLTRLSSGREVVQLPTAELARVAGSVHCITQQQPRA